MANALEKRDELVRRYKTNTLRKPTLDEVLTVFNPSELYLYSTAETRHELYIKGRDQRIWRGGGFGRTLFIEALFKHVGIKRHVVEP